MKTLMTLILVCAALFFPKALANTTPIADQNNVFKNYLVNPGFENGSVSWAVSGGTGVVNTTAKGEGNYGYSWDSNGTGQTLLSSAITIPAGLYGKNGMAYCSIKSPSSQATHTITVNDGTNDIQAAQTISSSTSFQTTLVNFIFPSSGTIKLKIASVSANEPVIYVDSCYIGEATNFATVTQPKLLGTATITACAGNHTTTSTTYADFGTQASCSYTFTGSAVQPATNIPALNFAVIPAGEIMIVFTGGVNQTTASKAAQFRFTDGTNTARASSNIYPGGATNVTYGGSLVQTLTYTAPQANISIKLQAKTDSGGTASVTCTTAEPCSIAVYVFPSLSELVVQPNQQDYDWTAWTPTFTGFGTPTSVSFFQRKRGSNLEVIGTLVTGTVSATPGSMSLPTALSLDTTKIPTSNTIAAAGTKVGDLTGSSATQGAHVVTATGTSTTLLYFSAGAATAQPSQLVPNATNFNVLVSSTTSVSISFSVPIAGWIQSNHVPAFIGQVSSNTTGQERIERVSVNGSVCSSSPCTLASQTGSWVTSITRSATGSYTLNIAAGMFTSAPICMIQNALLLATSHVVFGINQSSATTTAVSFTSSTATGAAAQDSAFNIICMGAK